MLEKFKNFWKKYKIYILISMFIGCLIGFIVVLFLNKNISTEMSISNIPSPFAISSDDFIIETKGISVVTDITEEILKITKGSDRYAKIFIDKYYDSNEITSQTDIATFWNFDGNIFSYINNTGLFFVNSSKGIKTGYTNLDIQKVKSFIENSFPNITISDIEVSQENDSLIYAGYYLYNEIEVGSLYLQGYAFRATFTENGNLTKLEMLTIEQENITSVQNMPVSSLEELINISNYPKYVKHNSYDENYSKQFGLIQASTTLQRFLANNIKKNHVFIDYDYKYIVPMYILSGDGTLEDSQGDEYSTNTDVFISSLDPKYLTERVVEEPELLDIGD